ncbi:DUF397 domain-containing protein [Streptomyces sp. NPDC093097]|uniref:DUF397 domain-containing protein n=1 Tax=Streptomyces sp. NPDC093097 TaxID=3366027 RepID=UPI0038292CCD
MTAKIGCVLMAHAVEGALWKKSSYSGGSESQCVEVAEISGTHSGIAIRDSKDPQGPALVFSAGGWSTFISAVRCAEELHKEYIS